MMVMATATTMAAVTMTAIAPRRSPPVAGAVIHKRDARPNTDRVSYDAASVGTGWRTAAEARARGYEDSRNVIRLPGVLRAQYT